MRRYRIGPRSRPGFSVPRRLIAYEYFKTQAARETKEQRQQREKYRRQIDFAWFAVNLGYSKADYNALTPIEKAFIRKAHEDKVVFDSTILRDAVMNAEYNVNRKKHKPFKKLWTRIVRLTKADKATQKKKVQTIKEIEKKETGWVRKIYEANGWIKKDKKKKQ